MKFLVRCWYDNSGHINGKIEEIEDFQSRMVYESSPCSIDDFIEIFYSLHEAQRYLRKIMH
ncbi:MAG: hypothetical protein N2Z65_01605 [Clostridiales bacterium]|nr:hypothetical protein [Clostridiales bacterium]